VAGSDGDVQALVKEAAAILRTRMRGATEESGWRLSGMRGRWEGSWSAWEDGTAEALCEVLGCQTPFRVRGSSAAGGDG
jgi:hypothetical protein